MLPIVKCEGSDGSLGARVRYVRREYGWTQEKLAERAGLHENYISRLENGHQEPRVSVVRKLATALGVPPGKLLDP